MLLSMLLTAALGAQAPPPRPAPSAQARDAAPVAVAGIADAAALAERGDLGEALRAFQQIAAANPQDREARLWIARLHVRMGHPDRAESVYRSVMLEDPADVRATVGVGTTLIARREYKEAIDVLEAAEKTAPRNPDVLAALGQAYAESGREDRSIGYLQRVVVLDPSAQNRRALERARLAFDHRVEFTALDEQFKPNIADTRGADLSVNVRLSSVLRLSGRGQWQRKFGREDTRGGVGLEWRLDRRTTIAGDGLAGARENRVLPRYEGHVAIDHVRGGAQWELGARYLDFFGARVAIVTPAMTCWPTARTTLDLRYDVVVTQYSASPRDTNHSGLVRGSYALFPRLSLVAGYARGVENFDAVSIDRIGPFRANTASAGVRLDLPARSTVFAGYEHQWREQKAEMGRVSVKVSQRF